MKSFFLLILSMVLVFSLSACSPNVNQESQEKPAKLQVVATTTIVADVVAQIGGDAIELTALLPPKADPHSYQPTPQDLARVADAQVLFISGAGLEAFIQDLLENSGTTARQVALSEGIQLLETAAGDEHQEDDHAEHPGDPHVWMDPNNILIWVDHIERVLIELDSQNAAFYQQNAAAYRQTLRDLDQWIVNQVDQIPPSRRVLVTDHQVFTYFAARYGFEQIGAIVPGFSTLSEPSAQELAKLEDTIRDMGVAAIFVGNTVNPSLAKRVADDTGTRLVQFYTGSLTDPSGPAATYVEYMRFNVQAIVGALK